MLTVPFENLDIGLGRRIILNEDVLYEKIVAHRRGGFCYELNGLFAALLKQLGFDITLLSARVFDPDGEPGREFGHLLILVKLDRSWIADVGFGDWFAEPLRLETNVHQSVGAKHSKSPPTANTSCSVVAIQPPGTRTTGIPLPSSHESRTTSSSFATTLRHHLARHFARAARVRCGR